MTEDGKKIVRRIREAIERVVPEGMESWDGVLPLVRGPTDRFLDALDVWLEEDTPETGAILQGAADNLVRAWKKAGMWFLASRERTAKG